MNEKKHRKYLLRDAAIYLSSRVCRMEEYESMSNIEASTCRERSQNSKYAGVLSGVVAVAG